MVVSGFKVFFRFVKGSEFMVRKVYVVLGREVFERCRDGVRELL